MHEHLRQAVVLSLLLAYVGEAVQLAESHEGQSLIRDNAEKLCSEHKGLQKPLAIPCEDFLQKAIELRQSMGFSMLESRAPSEETGVVVAHHDEDLTWIDSVFDSPKYHIYVYSKGSMLPNITREHKWTKVWNVGREGLSYLTHIIPYYDQLEPNLIFVPGNAWTDKRKRALLHAAKAVVEGDQLLALGGFAPAYESNCDAVPDLLNFSIMKWCSALHKDPHADRRVCKMEASHYVNYAGFRGEMVPEWLRKQRGDDSCPLPISQFGVFAARRENLRRVDMDNYYKMHMSLNWKKNPADGHYMERLWAELLQEKIIE
mmetsp:Transcript_30412/g.56839  ORF Transcript_30412/g.56839 Transcript_30412/m.56839 type:complete len:317 (-) Transcript_30412:198-1148(-)